jgi:DNA-binding winged helix-turn-helix (wHTH) protein
MATFGPFTFDRVSRLLRREGAEVPLPPRVLGVLVLLLEPPGEVVTKQALISAVWRDAFVTETSIAEAISVLRQTLGDDPQRPIYIQTLHRRGYRFIAEVVDAAAALSRPPGGSATVASVDKVAPVAVHSMAPEPRLSLLVPWLAALFSVLIAAVAVWRYVDTTAPIAPAPVRFTIVLPPGLTMAPTGAPLAVSNDGSTIAFAACEAMRCAIYLRPMSQAEVTPVAGTTGGTAPFFSADGRVLGFFADGRLQTIALGGGAPVTVARAAEPWGATWLADGQIVFARSAAEGLFVVGPTGDNLRLLTSPAAGEGGHRWPASLPDGSAIVFTVSADPARSDEHYGALVSIRTGGWGRILDGVGAVRAPTPDHLIAQRGDGLVASWLDARTHSLVGLPATVASPGLRRGAPHYAVNQAGTLVTVAPSGEALHVVLHWAGDLRRLVPPPQPALPR